MPPISPTSLTGLRERASLLGGTLVLDSGGEGLRVVARLPWGSEQ